MTETSTLKGINRAFKERGGPAMRNARKAILQTFKDESICSQALRYFSKVTLHSALPVFPALLSMGSEAVGGDQERAVPFGEAIVFISAAADLHDDVIDQSFYKGSRKTVYGKFGSVVSLLAGDILFTEGLRKLCVAAEVMRKEKSVEIMRLISEAVSEICNAEALETQLRIKKGLTPDDYQEIIRLKAVVPEVSMKIGAIVGNGNNKDVENLGQFGRIFGINSIILEELIDLMDIEELKNRLKNESLPLPLIYALQNPKMKHILLPLLTDDLHESAHKKLINMVLGSKEIMLLQNILTQNAKSEQTRLSGTLKGNIEEELKNLLLVPLQLLEV